MISSQKPPSKPVNKMAKNTSPENLLENPIQFYLYNIYDDTNGLQELQRPRSWSWILFTKVKLINPN